MKTEKVINQSIACYDNGGKTADRYTVVYLDQPDAAPEFIGAATYSPEDNKLRLYIGRVPRDEFLKLRADGWTALHKQREAGQGDFAATWTPSRRDTALAYAGIIEDEDAGPAERAADRAERFSGYREKRTIEAGGIADKYDAGPSVHGYQSQARAERAAARHDRQADRAGDAWNKAEYWQRRTAGVISHALYKSEPGVRMGRIKTIEAELRRDEKTSAECAERFETWRKIAAMTDAEKQTALAERFAGIECDFQKYKHPRTGKEGSLWDFIREDAADRITGAEAAALYMEKHRDPLLPEFQETSLADWIVHHKLRLAYENQMLAAAGGMLEQFEVLPGGKLGGKLIVKVSKSSATKRATSCDILGPKVSGWTYKAANIPGTEFAAYKFDLERIAPGMYSPPTPESLAELAAFNASRKANAPKVEKAPLINPTDADAERLQALWNERALAEHEARNTYNSPAARAAHSAQFTASAVCRTTQAVYSANSKGSYAKAETRGLCAGGKLELPEWNMYSKEREAKIKAMGPAVCIIRKCSGDKAERVIVLTDKPQKPLPAALWEPHTQAAPHVPAMETGPRVLAGKSHGLSYTVNA